MGITRRGFIGRALGACAALGASGSVPRAASAQAPAAAELERNKAIALRFKKAQGTKDEKDVLREVLAPSYKRLRGGMHHLAANAQGQGFPSAGAFLRAAIPDREDVIEQVIAEGDKVGILFRLTGTHQGNLFGIPPSGRKIDAYEAAILTIADGRIVEGWFMADEAAVLKQVGGPFPARKDGRLIVPPVTNTGEDPDAVLKRLESVAAVTQEDRNRLAVARSKGSAPPGDLRGPGYKQLRNGFPHLREYGVARGAAKETVARAFPDRRDRIDGFLAEKDRVWMRFKVCGTHTVSMYGMAPTGRVVEVDEIATTRFADGKWVESWYFGDELGMILQLGLSPNLLLNPA